MRVGSDIRLSLPRGGLLAGGDSPLDAATESDACAPASGQFGPHAYPPACYQFYSPTDPLSTAIPASPTLGGG